MSFDPFNQPFDLAAVKTLQAEEAQTRRARSEDLKRALGHGAPRAALEQLLREEESRPSFIPADTFEDTAWREGRKAMLRDMLRQITTSETE